MFWTVKLTIWSTDDIYWEIPAQQVRGPMICVLEGSHDPQLCTASSSERQNSHLATENRRQFQIRIA